MIRDVFAVMDKGRLPCAVYIEGGLQNAYYEGHTTSVEVTDFLVLEFHRATIYAGISFRGNWHDAKLANCSGLTYPKISNSMTLLGYATIFDRAIKTDVKETMEKILRALQPIETVDISKSFELQAIDLTCKEEYFCKKTVR